MFVLLSKRSTGISDMLLLLKILIYGYKMRINNLYKFMLSINDGKIKIIKTRWV
jgi:hypothetical protein